MTEMQEQSDTTKQMMTGNGRSGVFQKSRSEIDLRAILCPWHNWDTDVMCMDIRGVYLSIGHCLTYENGKGTYEFKCPYFQLEGHQVSDYAPGYIELPDNISELNDYICGPMNRKGFSMRRMH